MTRLLGVLALAAAIAWWLRRHRTWATARPSAYDFAVEFRDGRSVRVDGVIPRNVYSAFEDVAALASVDGRIAARKGGDLTFSPSIPEPICQQFRNAYVAARVR